MYCRSGSRYPPTYWYENLTDHCSKAFFFLHTYRWRRTFHCFLGSCNKPGVFRIRCILYLTGISTQYSAPYRWSGNAHPRNKEGDKISSYQRNAYIRYWEGSLQWCSCLKHRIISAIIRWIEDDLWVVEMTKMGFFPDLQIRIWPFDPMAGEEVGSFLAVVTLIQKEEPG